MGKLISYITRLSYFMKVLTFICLGCMLLTYLCPFVHPSDLWIIPFFGLAYPVILLFTLLFLVYWIFMKSRMAILIALVLFFGGKLHFRTVSMPFGTEEYIENDSLSALKITSYNVRLFDLYEWSDAGKYVNRNLIFKYLKALEFFRTNTGNIEVVRADNQLEKMYFYILPYCKSLENDKDTRK